MSVLKRLTTIRKRRSQEPEPTPDSASAGGASESRSDEVVGVDFIPPLDLEKKMPTYFTMGILAKQCLIRGYEIGIWHLECTTKSENFSTYSIGEANPHLNRISGGVGMRQKYGCLSVLQAWQTDGYLGMVGGFAEALGAMFYSVAKATYGPHGK